MTKPFDPTKPVQTRSGKKARILCKDLNHSTGKTILAAVASELTDYETISLYFLNGLMLKVGAQPDDLINVPEVVVTYLNVYDRTLGLTEYTSLDFAARQFGAGQIIKLSRTDGKLTAVELVGGDV